MKNNLIIACIPPVNHNDYLADTVFDGLASLQKNDPKLIIIVPDYNYPTITNFPVVKVLQKHDFIEAAKEANVIFLFNAGPNLNYTLADEVGKWDKTFFIDGSELGKNKRLDPEIVKSLSEGSCSGKGEIRHDLLKKCAGYFRREPPYIEGIIPLPFGIEKKYVKYSSKTKKDIDFVCVFGQEEYPPMRKEVRVALEDFCKKNGFSFVTKQTKLLFFSIHSLVARWRFYKTLARAKVGISVAGGGFDTLRFWEILGNNCLLLTDKIGIYEVDSKRLDYKRIWQFNNLHDFQGQLEKMGKYLKEEYNQKNLEVEYKKILDDHSTQARVEEILKICKQKNNNEY